MSMQLLARMNAQDSRIKALEAEVTALKTQLPGSKLPSLMRERDKVAAEIAAHPKDIANYG